MTLTKRQPLFHWGPQSNSQWQVSAFEWSSAHTSTNCVRSRTGDWGWIKRLLDHFWARFLDTPNQANDCCSITVSIHIHLLVVTSSYWIRLLYWILIPHWENWLTVLSLQLTDRANPTPHFPWVCSSFILHLLIPATKAPMSVWLTGQRHALDVMEIL